MHGRLHAMSSGAYAQRYRRLLVDTHFPDWDPGFFAKFDAMRTVQSMTAVGANALMVYFQSHTGLCNWNTATGRTHAGLAGRDVMGDLLTAAHARDVPVCAYYSVNFNNWAAEQHPDWKMVPAVAEVRIGGGLLPSERYGICCYNHPDYRAFVHQQTREIIEQYPVDGIFFDMIFWMSVCLCNSCRQRFRSDTGEEFPDYVNWLDPAWCRFQAVRERWLTEQACELHDLVARIQPDIPVYHNFAVAAGNWTRGLSFDSARAHTFLGGDFYGGIDEQLVISRLLLNLSESRPVEFMTSVSLNLAEHERPKPQEDLDTLALSTVSCHAAFLAILAFDPDGSVSPGALDRVRRTFDKMAPYERELGGRAIEEVAVYFSDHSKMSFAENGLPLGTAAARSALDYPHLHAVTGACRVLQRAHLPFGVITRKQLDTLDRYRVVVLPNVLRMTQDELEAFRAYVRYGGRLYASRYTSLTLVDGQRNDDFLLADVFGCRFESFEDGRCIYVAPIDERLKTAVHPERSIGHWIEPSERTGSIRLSRATSGRALATLTLPYGYPKRGSLHGRDWASIHSYPPWDVTDTPTIVQHAFGGGICIYSAADLEAGGTASHDAAFRTLVEALAGSTLAFACDAHPAVAMTVFDQADRSRWLVCFVNTADLAPTLPIPGFSFSLRPPAGKRFVSLRCLPGGRSHPFRLGERGTLHGTVPDLEQFSMFAAGLEDAAA